MGPWKELSANIYVNPNVTRAPRDRVYHHPIFATGNYRKRVNCQGNMAGKWQSWDLNPGRLAPQSRSLHLV